MPDNQYYFSTYYAFINILNIHYFKNMNYYILFV